MNKKLSLQEHLKELKSRFIIFLIFYLLATIICYIYAKEIFLLLMQPLEEIITTGSKKFIYTNLTEVFFSYIKLAFFSGFILSFPILSIQIYHFIAPALYKKEKKFFIPFITLSPILFAVGVLFLYNFIFPLAWKFFLSFEVSSKENTIPIILEAKVNEYLDLVINLVIAFGIAFQLPLILVLLMKFNIITSQTLKNKRKVVIVVVFVISAILTPPDVISQIALAIPMLILYEISIVVGKYIR